MVDWRFIGLLESEINRNDVSHGNRLAVKRSGSPIRHSGKAADSGVV